MPYPDLPTFATPRYPAWPNSRTCNRSGPAYDRLYRAHCEGSSMQGGVSVSAPEFADLNLSIPPLHRWLDAVIGASPEDSVCLLYTSPSPRDGLLSRMPSSA